MDERSFIDSLLPGNYFLTKSMELSRVGTSGTLWYTKKFLVLYYYIFLNDNITVKSTVSEICSIFDKYIDSLPESRQDAARSFFYSSLPVADLKSPEFRFFDDFAGSKIFNNEREKRDYYELAKKYYFAFLMESGGQSGVNKVIKERIYSSKFNCSQIEDIIRAYFTSIDKQSYNLTQVKNDYMAFLRNERQILFYYGFVHSKSNGSSDMEFSSLTPVGELALRSNYYELLAIWEHQKIKMPSQPVTVSIGNIDCSSAARAQDFHINNNPYLTILKCMLDMDGFSYDEYKLFISRLKSCPAEEVRLGKGFLDKIEAKIESFDRSRDAEDEDFQKELKKYLLGIRDDLKLDDKTNPLGLCSMKSGRVHLDKPVKLGRLIELYSILKEYKEEKYSRVFADCLEELRRQYGLSASDSYVINPAVKMEWDIYNIHTDLAILMSSILMIAESMSSMRLTTGNIPGLASCIHENFSGLLKAIGISGIVSLKKELGRLLKAIETKNFRTYIDSEDVFPTSSAADAESYIEQSMEDLRKKIMESSSLPMLYEDGVRKRNTGLIHLMKMYNIRMAGGELLKCECCAQTTFINKNDEPYMEYHHLIPFRDYDGADHYLNLLALCPMCHRKIHHLRLSEKAELYEKMSRTTIFT